MKSLAIQELIDTFRNATPEELVKQFDKEELRDIQEGLSAIEHDRLDELCSRAEVTPVDGCPDCFQASEKCGPLYWLQNLTLTTDDHWQMKGTPYKAPFPRKSYLTHLFGELALLTAKPELRTRRTFIPKSRDLMVSWSVMGFITWMCQWRPQTFWIAQSEKEDKAAELLTYSRTLYGNQPDWLQQRHPLVTNNVLEMKWANGSRILGLPSGADQIRVHHPHGWFADEVCFLSDFENTLNAVIPVVAQVVAVSTARAGNYFADACAT